MVRILIIVSTLFFVNSNISFGQNIEDLIIWSENKKLTWADFKGVNKDTLFKGAKSATGIMISPYSSDNKNYKYRVFAYFEMDKSFTDNDFEYILKHEQLHFDITELFARKIRKKYEFLEGKNLSVNYIHIYNEFFEKCNKYQDLYDLETAHGTIYKMQKKWEKKVVSELNSLKLYKF
jgi:hypothetical protein